jgi:hypothetical protein
MLTDLERERLDSAASATGKLTSTRARDELLQLAANVTKKKPAAKKEVIDLRIILRKARELLVKDHSPDHTGMRCINACS